MARLNSDEFDGPGLLEDIRKLFMWLYHMLIVFGGAALAGICSLWAGSKVIPPRTPYPPAWLFLGILVLCLQVATAGHELGHLFGARLTGFKPVEFFAGVLGLKWDGTWQFTFRPQAVLGGGHVLSIPKRFERLAQRLAVKVAGGPLASLLVTAVGFALCAGVAGRAQWQGYLAFFGLTLAGTSAYFTILSLMPYRLNNRGLLSDGARLVRLGLGGVNAARDLLLVAFGACRSGTVRPRELPSAWIIKALSRRDRSQDRLNAEIIAFSAAIDRREWAVANGHLQECLGMIDLLDRKVQPNLYLDAALMAAWYEKDAAKAAQFLARSEGGVGIERWHRCHTEGALALANGDPERALALARESLEAMAGQRETGLLGSMRDQLEQLVAAASAALAAAGQVPAEPTA